jgi:polyisoprenoid-binding protein YceI
MAGTLDMTHNHTALGVGDWQLLAEDSDISFQTRIAFGLIPVRGRFTEYTGQLHLDGSGQASGELRVEAQSIATGIGKRDRHLRSSDFFAVEEHPHMTFELAGLEADADGVMHLSGTLRIRGEALPIDTPVVLEQPRPDRLRVNADFAVEHRSSGLSKTGPGWKKVPQTLHAHVALTLAPSA